MYKINYQLESWICLYEVYNRTIEELENHYKTNPYKHIKEKIIMYLDKQKDLLMKINSYGFSKYFFESFKLNRKYEKESRELKKMDTQTEVVKSKKANSLTYRFATSLLVTSLLMSTPANLSEEHISGATISPSLVAELVEDNQITQEVVEVDLPEYVGSRPHIDFKTIELSNKYYDIECPSELQDYFYELENKWGVPASLAMLIVDQESDGHWNTNGVISPTNDYGLSQINECNHQDILNTLGYTSEDLKNDPYKNLDAMFYIISNIFHLYGYTIDNYDLENVCGTYNGYINWRNMEQSVTYVEQCMERYNTIFIDNNEEQKLVMKVYY